MLQLRRRRGAEEVYVLHRSILKFRIKASWGLDGLYIFKRLSLVCGVVVGVIFASRGRQGVPEGSTFRS